MVKITIGEYNKSINNLQGVNYENIEDLHYF